MGVAGAGESCSVSWACGSLTDGHAAEPHRAGTDG